MVADSNAALTTIIAVMRRNRDWKNRLIILFQLDSRAILLLKFHCKTVESDRSSSRKRMGNWEVVFR